MGDSRRVVIVQNLMKQYRSPLYQHLNDLLKRDGIKLQVLYSAPRGVELEKNDNVDLPEEYGLQVPNKHFFKGKLIWTECYSILSGADLVIVEQANRNLINYVLMLRRSIGRSRFAFWGHGRSHQANANSMKEKFKKIFLRTPDHWFAYTEGVKTYIEKTGFPSDRITALNNSIDTNEFRLDIESVSDIDVSKFKRKHGIPENAKVAMICSSLYREKKIEFLLDAIFEIKNRLVDFTFLVVGSGPDKSLLERAAENNNWIKLLGPLYGKDKALAFSVSSVVLNPGLVGLGILDCFVAGRPLITTNIKTHSPEISYLDNGSNGTMTAFDIDSYANAVIDLLLDEERLQGMAAEAKRSAERYSIENMALNFHEGIVKCLDREI